MPSTWETSKVVFPSSASAVNTLRTPSVVFRSDAFGLTGKRIENRPSFKQAAAAFGAPGQSSSGYLVPRRYVRVPLESPLRAQIEGTPAGLARVKTISLGGAITKEGDGFNSTATLTVVLSAVSNQDVSVRYTTAEAFTGTSYLLHSRNVEIGVARQAPADSDRLSTTGNLTN